MHMNTTPSRPSSPSRKERMAALALARPESLVDAAEQLPPLPPYTLPRRPEAGMIMAQARAGNTGQPFHLGEVLVTRCTVCLPAAAEAENMGGSADPAAGSVAGIMGHAWVRGRSPRHAELAALFDALWQHPAFAPLLDEQLWPRLLQERQERVTREAAAVAPSRVDFFTLVRGEDEA